MQLSTPQDSQRKSRRLLLVWKYRPSLRQQFYPMQLIHLLLGRFPNHLNCREESPYHNRLSLSGCNTQRHNLCCKKTGTRATYLLLPDPTLLMDRHGYLRAKDIFCRLNNWLVSLPNIQLSFLSH